MEGLDAIITALRSFPLRGSDNIALNPQYYNEEGFHSACGNLLHLTRKVTFCPVLQSMYHPPRHSRILEPSSREGEACKSEEIVQ